MVVVRVDTMVRRVAMENCIFKLRWVFLVVVVGWLLVVESEVVDCVLFDTSFVECLGIS